MNPLLEDAEFLADLRDESMSQRQIAGKWGVAQSTVSKYRSRVIEDDPLDRRFAEPNPARETREESTTGARTIEFIRTRPVTLEDARDWIRSTGDDPEDYELSVRSIAYGQGQSSNKMQAIPKRRASGGVEAYPLAHFYAEAEKVHVSHSECAPGGNLAIVVALADWQLGKTGRRGGTADTLARLHATRETLRDIYATRSPDRIVLIDLGDGIEGFESGGDPQFTNDLSLPDQLDAYATELYKFVRQADEWADVEVGITPSNHSAWRRGKQNLGKPTDDFGIYVHRQVAKMVEAAGANVSWHYPADYDESLLIDVMGTPVGAVHGNQFGPGKAIDWWQAQAFGSQAVTKADVLLTGHYHSYGAGVAGINPFTDRERMWLGCPTVDPGSDWYRAIRGRDSLPGTLIFEVGADSGFDLGSMRII